MVLEIKIALIGCIIITCCCTNEVMTFIFLADKTKSFKKKFRKRHHFFYRFFNCYIYNHTYMEDSRYKKILYIIYTLISFYCLMQTILLFFLFISGEQASNELLLLSVISIVLTIIYFLWCGYHSWNKKIDTKFGMGKEFYLKLPGLEEVKRRRNFK